jgi:hypothetical protein
MKFFTIALLLASTSAIRLVKDDKPKEADKKDLRSDGLVHHDDGTKSFPDG